MHSNVLGLPILDSAGVPICINKQSAKAEEHIASLTIATATEAIYAIGTDNGNTNFEYAKTTKKRERKNE